MSIQQSTELIIFVTHVEADESFLKIWGQMDKNSATCVERMILPLVEHFARSQGCVGSQATNLRPNALCCARFQNEGYYRAKVVSVRANGMVVLQFIDYGNVEVLPPQEIHLLENIPGSESLQSFPPVAFEFTLMHVLPVNGVWEKKIVESIKKILWYNEYKILIHTVVNNHLFIKLWYNNEDFSELMVDKRMAVRATLQEMFRSKCMQQVPIYPQPSKLLITNNCAPLQPPNPLRLDAAYQRAIPPCCAAQQKHLLQTSVQEALVFKSRVLDVPSKHDVFVSCVEDGPQKFSVQLQSTTQILSQLMRDINSHSIEPLQEPPLPGSVCLGRYTRDKVLCRAVVMSVMENKCKLYYVDFGHTEVLPYTDIFQLPPHFISPRVLSIRFTLSGVNELNVTEDMKKYFKQIVSGKLLVLHVRPPEGPPLVQYGDLYDEEKNIKDILRLAFPSPATANNSRFDYEPEERIGKGMEEIVQVSFVESCRQFFVQLKSNLTRLKMFMDDLAEFCEKANGLSLPQMEVGMACAALYDNQWYRAKILDVSSSESIKVLYVDYGNKETVSSTSLRAIREDLVKNLPAQAIRCSLNGWEWLPCTQELQNQFESLVLEKRLRLRVVETNSENLLVDLFEPDKNESVKSRMLRAFRGIEKTSNDSSSDDQESDNQPKMAGKINQNDAKWHKKQSPDSWQQQTTHSDKSKYKTWKDDSTDEKPHDSRTEKPNIPYHRFIRDEFPSNRRNSRPEPDNFKCSRGENRLTGGRSKIPGFAPKIHPSSNKIRSDKDSDTSSRGGNRRGRGGNRGAYRRGQSNNDGGFKTSKPVFDSHHAGGRFKERRGQGHRLSQNKLNATSSSSDGERRRINPMRSRSETNFKISRQNLTLGEVQRCEVVFANGCGDFFVQLSADFAALDAVMENIAGVYENGGETMKESEIISGSYCVALYSEDRRWYRALINSVTDKNAVVQFVDYGNTETVPFDRIKSIQKQFTQLPVQAIRCKLLGVDDDPSKMKIFEDLVAGKTLDVEFVSEENSIYAVLLKENPGMIVNEELCDGIDLTKAKEDARRDKNAKNSPLSNKPDYVPMDFDWSVASYANGTKKQVIITWLMNPNNFYCQLLDNEVEFRAMMNEIQKIYAGREPIWDRLRIGSPVIAIFAEDGALYRAKILELNKLNGHLVQYVDFGNTAIVNSQKIYPVEKKFARLPKQAVQCSLRDIVAKDENGWSKVDTKEIDACFNADNYECVFHEVKEEKYVVSLENDGKKVADSLVDKGLAVFSCEGKNPPEDNNATICDVVKVDINLLNGQTLRVKVSSFESAGKFYIQLPSAVECENMINSYMSEKNPEVMQRLSEREIRLGTGCLVCSNGVWRRAAVEISSRSRSTGRFHVKFIDTGAFDEIHSDSVVALPGELSAMQNQALECSLSNIGDVNDASLKEKVEGKEVIVYVDEVDNNRLLVKLYDATGAILTPATDDSPPKISPICPMPIFSSTHKVLVSFADHSSSVWLQRYADYFLDENLTEALDKHYSTSGEAIEPIENLICAVKGSDGHWYRGQILNQTPTGVCVKFIDYGNNEQVSRGVLKSLDSSFFVPHRLAVNVSLPVALNGPVNEQVNVLQKYLSNRELTGVFRNQGKKWIVELLCDGEKISDKFRALNLVSDGGAADSGPLFVHKMAVGPRYDVYVSHVDSPSQFWLQRVEDAADLARKQDDLQSEAPDFPRIDGILEEGSLCAAVYTIDNLWYRAEVIDADEDITTVRFVDYGNTDIIDNKIGNVRLIPDRWRSLPEYAVKCRLDVIPMDSEDWPTSTCERFESLIASPESLQVTMIADSAPKRVDLFVDDRSVSEILVEEKHAIKVRTEEELIDEIVDLELDPHSAFVSHINSPDEFWVQEEKSVGNLEVMSDRFIMADMFNKVEKVEEGLLCVAKYPEDKCWYRARVISANDDSTRVIYIDYGNSAVSTEIRAIPEDLADIPPLSRKCRLIVPEGIKEWSEKACEEFAILAADGATIFLLDVLKDGETSLVKLTLDGRNVSEILAGFCETAPVIEERLPPLGEENSPNVFISRVNSPGDFWVQTESSANDLNAMAEKLRIADNAFLPLCSIEIGAVCAAIFAEDELWYRAKILRDLGNGRVEVLYVDYGNIGITDRLRTLPLDIVNVAPLAKRCALQKPDKTKEWPPEARKMFEELAANGETMFQLEILDDVCEPVSVKLSFQRGNVADILLNGEEKMAAGEENGDGYHADVSGFLEEEKEEVDGDLEKSGGSVLELTVDEIVQNMKKGEFEEPEEEAEVLTKDTGTENVEVSSGKFEGFEEESGKIEDFEGRNGEGGNLGGEKDKIEDFNGRDEERGNLKERTEKTEEFEDEGSEERGNFELGNVETTNFDARSEGRTEIGSESGEIADIESKSEETAEIESKSGEIEKNMESKSVETANIESRSEEKAEIESKNAEIANIESRSEKSDEIESKSGEIEKNIESKSVETANTESRSEEKANIESRTEEKAEIESKSVEIPNVESRSEEKTEIESKSAETDKNIETRSEKIAEIESKSAEIGKNMESKSVETANIGSDEELLPSATKKTTLDSNSEEKNEARRVETTEDASISSKETRENGEASSKA